VFVLPQATISDKEIYRNLQVVNVCVASGQVVMCPNVLEKTGAANSTPTPIAAIPAKNNCLLRMPSDTTPYSPNMTNARELRHPAIAKAGWNVLG
jgi:hypothetical protein